MCHAILSLGLLVAPVATLATGPRDGTYVWEQGLGKTRAAWRCSSPIP